jgi:hypothetical protein
MICTHCKYYLSDQIEEDEIGGASEYRDNLGSYIIRSYLTLVKFLLMDLS